MRVTFAAVDLQSRVEASREERTNVRARTWSRPSEQDRVGVSREARELATKASPRGQRAGEAEEAEAVGERDGVTDPKLSLLIAFVERLSGRKVQLLDPNEVSGSRFPSSHPPPGREARRTSSHGDAPSGAGWGLEIVTTRVVAERDSTEFVANGLVRTADGREIRFAADLVMSRESLEIEQLQVRAGGGAQPTDGAAPVEDPLVLNFGSLPVALADGRQSFDIDADGAVDTIPTLANTSAFLTIDHNHNGQVDDGTELFGPTTGDGFLELRAFDEDANGWIDEADAAYERLGLWFGGADSIESLREHSVGAIYVGSVATPFELRASDDSVQGVVRATSVWLDEKGGAGTIQQVDLAKA